LPEVLEDLGLVEPGQVRATNEKVCHLERGVILGIFQSF
jgi:predicted hydrocarbon binding protein